MKEPLRLMSNTKLPVFFLHADEQVVPGDTGIVHQAVDGSMLFHDPGKEFLDPC